MPTTLPQRAEPDGLDDMNTVELLGMTAFYLAGTAFYSVLIAGRLLCGFITGRHIRASTISLCRTWLACRCLWLARRLMNLAVTLAPHLEGKNNA